MPAIEVPFGADSPGGPGPPGGGKPIGARSGSHAGLTPGTHLFGSVNPFRKTLAWPPE